MQLEQQVCSLELAKKLKELGVKQESLWVYDELGCLITRQSYAKTRTAAFTVAEPGVVLPKEENIVCMLFASGRCQYAIEGDVKYQGGGIQSSRWGAAGTCISGDTEADARARMLVYLLENKLTTL